MVTYMYFAQIYIILGIQEEQSYKYLVTEFSKHHIQNVYLATVYTHYTTANSKFFRVTCVVLTK